MKGRTIGLSLATLLLALPAFAQSHSQKEMQRQEQMQHDAQMRARANPSVTVDNLRDSYVTASEQLENRATKLSAEDYRALARQRRELDQAIRDIERGGSVGAGDVDRILGNDTVY